MPAEITSAVRLAVDMPDGFEVRAEVGTITVPVHQDGVELAEVRRALGMLLREVGAYLIIGGIPDAQAPRGEGESGSPA